MDCPVLNRSPPAKQLPAVRNKTVRLHERVLRELSAAITRGDYAVGDRLPSERELAPKFGVSRPTIREAIVALQQEGMVEVKMNSGVYVIADSPRNNGRGLTDMGPFELLEARRLYESETCALAASLIGDAELAELERLTEEMEAQSLHDIAKSEDADRRFHHAIACATQNSAMVTVIEVLWDLRDRSAQYKLLCSKVRSVGVFPRLGEHGRILKALKDHDPAAARAAMWEHLTSVIDALLQATDFHAMARAKKDVEERTKPGKTR
jgi:DNA-binding FadR family transcriptional regulator